MRRQVAKFQKLKSEGYKFPVPWGHRLSAVPERRTCTEAEWQKAVEQRAFEEARYNAGYVEDLRIDKDGDLQIILPAPPGYRVDHQTGDLVNERDGTRIREVSGAFGDWTDGKGRTHRDILIHAALCVRPVWGNGQPGFELDSGNQKTLATGMVRYTHTLSTRTGGSSMPKNDMIEDEDIDIDEDPADDDEPVVSETEAVVDPAPAPVKVRQPDMFEQCVSLLNQAGLTMPTHTTEDNFIEHLVTALTVAISMGAKFERAEEDETPPPAPAATTDQPPMPEAPPVMMSTDQFSARERVWAEKESKRTRKRIAANWRHCRDRLGLFPDIADREAQKVSQIQLSFLPNGDVVAPPDLRTVLIVREILQRQQGISPERLSTLATATMATAVAVPNPITKKGADTSFAQKMLSKIAPDAKLASVN